MMPYYCLKHKCKYHTDSRKQIREHAKKVHGLKGAKKFGDGKDYESPISKSYERR